MPGPHPDTWLEVRPEGLHCRPGGFFVDPLRPVGTAVVSHGHSDHARPGHDRVLATRYGAKAFALAKAGEFGRMVSLQGDEVGSVPLSEVTGIKTVDLELLEIAKRFFA